ncbi:MAG: hypothetical protein AAFY28_03700 [Actinomycetota bacterium]
MSGSDLVADARRFAGFHAVESALFVVTGRWIERFTEPAHRVRAGTWNRYHAEHIELWAARFPTIDELPPIDVMITAADVDLVAGAGDVDTVVGVVLPRLAAAYDAFTERIDPRLDGPTARILDVVRRDTAAELTELTPLASPATDAPIDPTLASTLERILA